MILNTQSSGEMFHDDIKIYYHRRYLSKRDVLSFCIVYNTCACVYGIICVLRMNKH